MAIISNNIHPSTRHLPSGRVPTESVSLPVPSETLELSGSREAEPVTKPFSKRAANVVSLLTIGAGIAVGAATGMLALPAVLIGVGLVSGAMSMEQGEGSKLSAWMSHRGH